MLLSCTLLVLELLLTSHSSHPHNLALKNEKCYLGVFIYFIMSPILMTFPLKKTLSTTMIINSERIPPTEKFSMRLWIVILWSVTKGTQSQDGSLLMKNSSLERLVSVKVRFPHPPLAVSHSPFGYHITRPYNFYVSTKEQASMCFCPGVWASSIFLESE